MSATGAISILEQGISRGLHLGAQIYVSSHGRVVVDEAIGEARMGEAMTRDHLMLWMSAGKPVTAIAIGQQIDRGKITVDTPVAQIVPDFAKHGKERILLRHLLNHTAGFRGPMGSFTLGSWDEIIGRVCNMRLEPGWIPGKTAGYHIASSWYILAEIVRRLDGRPIEQYVRDEIFLPLGQTDAWIGMPPVRYEGYGPRIAPMYETSRGWPDESLTYNGSHATIPPRPAANARGPIRALGRIYECLLDGGTPLLSRETTRLLTSRQRQGMIDLTFKAKLDWGFGFMIDSKGYTGPHSYGYGKFASADTFGHSGNQCSCAFADPANGLVVAWACNGMPGESDHQIRQHELNTRIYQD